MNNFGVGAMYIHRKYHNFCGSAQQGCVGGAVRYLDSSANYTGPENLRFVPINRR